MPDPTTAAPAAAVIDVPALVPSLPTGMSLDPRGNGNSLIEAGVVAMARLSDEEFDARIQMMRKGLDRVNRVKLALLIEDKEGDGSGDYGKLPGMRTPCIYRSGSEKLANAFNLVVLFRPTVTYGNGETAPEISVVCFADVHLGDSNGPIVGQGLGGCNTWETRYKYRTANAICPKCAAAGDDDTGTIRKSNNSGEGWYCWRKRGGCGAQFAANAPEIVNQERGKVRNKDPHDLQNTIVKMASIRSYKDGVARVTATSNIFTQDLDDYHENSPNRPGFGPAVDGTPDEDDHPRSETRTVPATPARPEAPQAAPAPAREVEPDPAPAAPRKGESEAITRLRENVALVRAHIPKMSEQEVYRRASTFYKSGPKSARDYRWGIKERWQDPAILKDQGTQYFIDPTGKSDNWVNNTNRTIEDLLAYFNGRSA